MQVESYQNYQDGTFNFSVRSMSRETLLQLTELLESSSSSDLQDLRLELYNELGD